MWEFIYSIAKRSSLDPNVTTHYTSPFYITKKVKMESDKLVEKDFHGCISFQQESRPVFKETINFNGCLLIFQRDRIHS